MTHRDLILRTLRGEETDRVPYVDWLGFAPWGETRQRWLRESGLSREAMAEHLGLQPFFQTVPVEYGPFPHFAKTIVEQNDEFVVSIDWRGITTRARRDGRSMPEWMAHPVRNRADWERYKAERLQPRLDERLVALEPFLRKMSALDAPVQAGTFPWGVFGTASTSFCRSRCRPGATSRNTGGSIRPWALWADWTSGRWRRAKRKSTAKCAGRRACAPAAATFRASII
jgi:hypothetical protein